MKLDFYYFSYQCPLNHTMIELLEEYKDRIDIHMYDISHNYSLAKEMNIYFPTLIILDDVRRYYSPLSKSFLEQVMQGLYPEERPYLPQLSDVAIEQIIEPLRKENVSAACECCGNKSEINCMKKQEFLENYKQEIYGFLHIDKVGNLVGGAEYLPSTVVPYHIPHNKEIAFLTCVYMSDTEYDYKSAPLKALEKYLEKDFLKLIAITDEVGVFPNGNLKFFTRNGYKDEGVIFNDVNYCRLHLVSKLLKY